MGTPRSGFRSGGGGGAGGDVAGPGSSTDNAVTRFDGTDGKTIQNSAVTIDDTGLVAGATIPYTLLQDGTDGELITWDASGNISTVGAGTAAQVLTSNGPGAAPTFQDAAGGGIGPQPPVPSYDGSSWAATDAIYQTASSLIDNQSQAPTANMNADTIYFMPVLPVDRDLYLYNSYAVPNADPAAVGCLFGIYSWHPNANQPKTLLYSGEATTKATSNLSILWPNPRPAMSAGTWYWIAYLCDTTLLTYGMYADAALPLGTAAHNTTHRSQARYRTLANAYSSGFPATVSDGATTAVATYGATWVPMFRLLYRDDDPA